MKKLCIAMLILGLCLPFWADDNRLENYISSFDSAARKEMKMDSDFGHQHVSAHSRHDISASKIDDVL
nr:hypothetical protein [uncultured Desulfobacter sp.]